MTGRDPLHVPWAFSLAGADRLPLTGERHPLRKEAARWLTTANAIVVLAGALVFAGWLVWSHLRPEEPVAREIHIVRYTELGVPPSIAKPAAPQINVAQAVARAAPPPSIGVPEPVPDEMATNRTIATMAEMSEALAPVTLSDLGLEGGDSLVVDLDIAPTPSPNDFVAVEEEPVRISIDPPVYPSVARSAEVSGTVLVRALVGKDGRVRDCIVVDGNPMLRDAAIACAKTAVFRPALLQHRPVEVWVMMPITFRLND
jgi:protein TonB